MVKGENITNTISNVWDLPRFVWQHSVKANDAMATRAMAGE